MVPRPIITIYLAGDNEFYIEEHLIADVEKNITEQDMIIENITEFLQSGE